MLTRGERIVVRCAHCGAPTVRAFRAHRLARSPMPPSCDDVCRFWAQVGLAGQSECWPWLGSRRGKGYGPCFWRGQNARKAHRIAFYLTFGSWPRNVLHRCDNPACCNPTHLEDGSIHQNNRQMWRRGRHWLQRPGARPRGERHGGAKLTEADVRAIRLAYAAAEANQYALAARYGVGQRAVWSVIHRKTWKHVP